MGRVGSDALRHLSDVLARKPELASDRISMMANHARHGVGALAIARFLAHSPQRQQHEEMLRHIVRFMDDLPSTSLSDPFPSDLVELAGYLEAIAKDWPAASQALSESLVRILDAPSHASPCKAFLSALSTTCFHLDDSVLESFRQCLLDRWVAVQEEDNTADVSVPPTQIGGLERQRIGLRLFMHALPKSTEAQVQPFWTASAKQIRALIPLLKLRKRDAAAEGPSKLKMCLMFEISQAAANLQTKALLIRGSSGTFSEGLLWETLTLFMDAADACIASPWRRLKACESLFDSLLSGVSDIVVSRGNQAILHRLRLLVLRTCAYADTWGTNQGPFFRSVVRSSCAIIHAGWNTDRSAVESFLLSLAAHIRQQSEQDEKEKQVVAVMQLNVIPLLADIAVKLNRVEAVDVIMPMFIESLEEGEASVPSLLRLRFLDAVARVASMGFEKSYREAVALLMKSYSDKLSTVGSTHSRTLAPEATTERVETLPAAFYSIATTLGSVRLRADYRLRLLTLCSDVGLVAEAKSGRSGADLLGPLLPAVAEICSDFEPSRDVEPSLLKLFRNLWFYIVLFGLAPPIQKPQSSSKSSVPSISSLGSMSAMALQAVAGPYLWNAQWSAAVQRITEATPPLVSSSMKWLEDELELNALHNPGSRRGSNNEKAALAQRAALAAALGGRVEVSSMSTISGVKATYLLAVSFLELLRFSCNGGILRKKGAVLSSLSYTLVYLETPHLTPDVYQCVSAIVHRSFDAAMNWLANTSKEADQRETVLVAHATYLIQHLMHRNENIREMADSLLSQLRNRYPQALWNARCLDALLYLVESTSPSADQRALVLQRVREWITYSLLLAPGTTQGLLQEHLLKTWQQDGGSSELLSLFSELQLDVSKVDGSTGQTAFIPAVTAAAAAAAVGNAQNANIKVLSGVTSVNWKSTAMQRSREVKAHSIGFSEEACTIMFSEFVQSLQHFVTSAEKGQSVDGTDYRKACHQASALLLSDVGLMSTTEKFVQLLRLLCWCPAYVFTPAAMETGIFVWTWLLSAAPDLGSLILSELVDAWLWTVDTNRGIFAAGIENSGPAAKLRPHLTPGEPGTVGDPVQGILAHRLWLGFLLERFEVVKYSSNEELLLIGRLLQGSVKSPQFTWHPAATGTFFTLMLLGLKFCSWQSQAGPDIGGPGVFLLEDKIYRAALAWFSVEPGWYDSKLVDAQSEAQAMTAFLQQLSTNQSGHACSSAERGKRKQLLLLLCQHEADRLETWAFPLRDFVPRLRVHADRWPEYLKTAWSLDPRLALALAKRFPFATSLKSEISIFVQEHLTELRRFSEALPYFVTPRAVDENSAFLQQLPHWAPCSITRALEFLTPPYKGHPRVMAYVLRVLESYPPERVLFFMPQLVQALRYDEGGLVEGYLMVAAKRSNLFAHILIWQLQGEELPSEEASKEASVSKGPALSEIVLRVKRRIIDSFSAEAFDLFIREFRLFDQVTSISGLLYPLPKEERRAGIRRELEKIQVEGDDLYLPTAPSKLVRGFKLDSGIPLQSAAKVPIMITFKVVDNDGDNEIKYQACIFKVGDDCRQDVLALQVIALLRDIFQAVGLDLYLFPYGVLPTGYGRGIIEVVPNTRSRNQMGEMSDGGLYELFQQDYGPVGSPRFEAARDNFIISSAGYAVASLLLQPKDRHNGNLLFDSEGRLVHIDFGFILETSPGGNMRFESAQFKLSHEMTQLIDPSGAMKSDSWNRFVSLCVKGYLAARQHMDGIVNTVLLMMDSGLPCFSRGDPIGNLRRRFHPEMSEREAANFMIRTCADAYNKWSTAGYDLIQYLQQGIEK